MKGKACGCRLHDQGTSYIYDASIVSRETVSIALMIATINDLKVKLGNILNAYVWVLVTEKVWTMLGPEFGRDARRSAVIIRALYGLKMAGMAF